MANEDRIFLSMNYGLVCTQNLYTFNFISKEMDAVPSTCRQNAGGKMTLCGSIQYLQFQQPCSLQIQCWHFHLSTTYNDPDSVCEEQDSDPLSTGVQAGLLGNC